MTLEKTLNSMNFFWFLYMSVLPPVITIDGPGGTGKGTLCQKIAHELGWHFLDSGVIYRVLALAALQNGTALDDEKILENMALELDIKFQSKEIGDPLRIILNGQDVTEAVRSETCGDAASKISAFPLVRLALLNRQRAFRKEPGLVTDGRDMGTLIFPDADLKFFLTATPEERARRRYNQLKQQGIHVSLHEVLDSLRKRDERDENRAVAPLRPAPDAIIIDTSDLSIDQAFVELMAIIDAKFSR